MNFSYMFNKKNYILFAILIILAGGTYLYTVPFQQWQQKRASGNETNFLRNAQMSTVDKIEVTDTAGKIFTITKNNGTWFLQPDNWPTEKILTDALEEKMTAIANAHLEVISINPDNKASFGITDTAMKAKFFNADKEAGSFIIGNIASDYQSTYIGRENDDKTYSVKETLTRAFDVEDWRDRTITNAESANVDAITLTYPSQQIELTKQSILASAFIQDYVKKHPISDEALKQEFDVERRSRLDSFAFFERNDRRLEINAIVNMNHRERNAIKKRLATECEHNCGIFPSRPKHSQIV